MRRRQREEEGAAGFTCTCKIHSANQGGVLNHLTVVIHDHLKQEEFEKSVVFIATTTDLVSYTCPLKSTLDFIISTANQQKPTAHLDISHKSSSSERVN